MSHTLAATQNWGYRAAVRWWTWTWIGALWLLLCLPVITGPVATLWMVTQEQRFRRDEVLLGLRESIAFFRARLVSAWRLFGVHLGVAVLVASALFGPAPNRWFGMAVGLVAIVVASTWVLVTPWSVVTYSRLGEVRAALRLSYRLAVTRVPLAICSAAAILAVPLVAAIVPRQVALLIWPVLPAIATTIVIALCERAAKPTAALRKGRVHDQ